MSTMGTLWLACHEGIRPATPDDLPDDVIWFHFGSVDAATDAEGVVRAARFPQSVETSLECLEGERREGALTCAVGDRLYVFPTARNVRLSDIGSWRMVILMEETLADRPTVQVVGQPADSGTHLTPGTFATHPLDGFPVPSVPGIGIIEESRISSIRLQTMVLLAMVVTSGLARNRTGGGEGE